MKNTKTILATILKSILAFSIIISTYSCSGDDDNNDDDNSLPNSGVSLPANLLTTYTGTLSYKTAAGESIVATLNGTATITGSSSNYTISFSDDVPNVSGITFALIGGDYMYINPKDDSEGIIIDEDDNSITIGLTINDNTIAFVSR